MANKFLYKYCNVKLNDKYSIKLPKWDWDLKCTVIDFVQDGVESKLNVILNFDEELPCYRNGFKMNYYEFLKCIRGYLGKDKSHL